MKNKPFVQKLNSKYTNYLLISISLSSFLFCGANLFQILASSIYPYEFDTSYVINMVIGTLKHGIPNFNNIYGNSIWTCAEFIRGECFNPDIANYHQNDVLPIDHSSGYLLVFVTALFTKLSLFLNSSKTINSQELISYIIQGYSSYSVLVYLLSFISLLFSIYFLNKVIKINLFEKLIIIIIYLSVPFCGIYSVTDRIIGEFSAVIYLSCAYIIFSISSISSTKYIIEKKYLDKRLNNIFFRNLNYVSLILFFNLLLSVESKSSVLPTAISILFSQFILVLIPIFFIKYKNKTSQKFNFEYFKFIKKFSLFFIGLIFLFIANKFIPLLGYFIFRRSDLNLFISKSKDFINYQSNAGRSWGGDSIDFFTNIKNNLFAYNLTKVVIPISLIFSLILLIGLFYKSLKYLQNNKVKNNLFLGLNLITISTCNLFIMFGAWSYSLIYKFPYPRTIFISIVFSLINPICLSLLYKNFQNKTFKI